jgi:hypothetical protein
MVSWRGQRVIIQLRQRDVWGKNLNRLANRYEQVPSTGAGLHRGPNATDAPREWHHLDWQEPCGQKHKDSGEEEAKQQIHEEDSGEEDAKQQIRKENSGEESKAQQQVVQVGICLDIFFLE